MIWQRPAAAKKIPNATVPQPKFVNLKLLNCYNNAAIKNHLPLIYIYIYDILLYDINTSWTHPQQLPTPPQVSLHWSWDLGPEFNDPSHAREVCSRSVVHQKGRQHQCVLSIWSRLNPSSQPGDDQPIFLAKFCHVLQRWSKYMYQKPPGQQHQFLAVFHPFWLATGLIFWCSWMFLMVFFINLSQGLVYPLPWKM